MSEMSKIARLAAGLAALTSYDLTGGDDAFGQTGESRGRFEPREPSGKDRSKVKAARAQRVRQK